MCIGALCDDDDQHSQSSSSHSGEWSSPERSRENDSDEDSDEDGKLRALLAQVGGAYVGYGEQGQASQPTKKKSRSGMGDKASLGILPNGPIDGSTVGTGHVKENTRPRDSSGEVPPAAATRTATPSPGETDVMFGADIIEPAVLRLVI